MDNEIPYVQYNAVPSDITESSEQLLMVEITITVFFDSE